MSDIYSTPSQIRAAQPLPRQEGTDLSLAPLEVKSAGINITSRPFAGNRWFAIAQEHKGEVAVITVTGDELDQLISVLREEQKRAREGNDAAPEQLRLFDPDSLEDLDDPRLDTA